MGFKNVGILLFIPGQIFDYHISQMERAVPKELHLKVFLIFNIFVAKSDEKSFFGFRVLIRSITNIMKIVFLDLLKPKGLHFGCNLISEIPNYSISTYKRDFTGRERNKKLDLFTTAPMNNPYTAIMTDVGGPFLFVGPGSHPYSFTSTQYWWSTIIVNHNQ